MSVNQIVVLLLEIAANERMAAVVAKTMQTLTGQSEWYAVLQALTYRGDAIRQQLAQEDPALVHAAAARLVETPVTPAPSAWSTDLQVGTRVH